jgi:hypothetical protein
MKSAGNFVEALLKLGMVLRETLGSSERAEISLALGNSARLPASLANMPAQEVSAFRVTTAVAKNRIMLRSWSRNHRYAWRSGC